MKRHEAIRAKAAMAAAAAFQNPRYSTGEELWSLAVFFELFITKGGDGTLKEFGPPQEDAQILRLVK